MKRFLIAVVVALFMNVAGAAEAGAKFEIVKADAYEQGVTTLDDAKTDLGNPISVSTDAEGNQTLWWKYAKVNLFGKDVRKLALVFDKEGKLLRVAHREVLN